MSATLGFIFTFAKQQIRRSLHFPHEDKFLQPFCARGYAGVKSLSLLGLVQDQSTAFTRDKELMCLFLQQTARMYNGKLLYQSIMVCSVSISKREDN